jgi:glyoxylase I family protein
MPSRGRNEKIAGGGFHHVAIRVRDFDRSVAFYSDVLGFVKKIEWGQEPGRAIMLDTGDGNYLELFERPSQPRPSEEGVLLHFALRTSDCSAALERARSAGCEVTTEPKDVVIKSAPRPTPVRLAFFKGPDGEVIELFQNEMT